MFEQLEELIQLRQDNDTGAAICGAAFVRIVWSDGYIFTAAGCRHVGRVEAIFLLKDADDGGRTFGTQVPVILDRAGMVVGLIVRMAFDHEFDIGLSFQDGCDLTEDDFGGRCYVPLAAIEQEFVGDVDIDDILIDLDIDVLVIDVGEGAFEVHHKSHVQGVFVGQCCLQILDVKILSADVIQRFLDAFGLSAGNDGEVLQLFEGGVVVLLGQVQLFLQIVELFLQGGFCVGVCGCEVVTVFEVSGQLGVCGG